jgi:hypothetical protein
VFVAGLWKNFVAQACRKLGGCGAACSSLALLDRACCHRSHSPTEGLQILAQLHRQWAEAIRTGSSDSVRPLSGDAQWLPSLVLETPQGEVTIFNESTYSFRSTDNTRRYETEICLSAEHLNSVHGVRAEGKWSTVFGASGCTTVHQHSAIDVDGRLFLAVGDHVVCLNLVTGLKEWSRQADPVTCFGVHWDCDHQALISHGELQISRLSVTGDEIWSATGADIFSEGFSCREDAIEVIDFNRSVYLFDYRTGALLN